MACILRITGEYLDIDGFLTQSGIIAYRKFYKGDPKFKTKPEGVRIEYSGCAVEVSNAAFGDFKTQAQDAARYLNENKEKLAFIGITPTIQYATLDFGVTYDSNKFTQAHLLSRQLLKLVADLGLSIEFSIYQSTDL